MAVAFSMARLAAQVEGKTGDDRARGLLAAFRGELYRCFAAYRDALLGWPTRMLCKQDRVHMLAELSLEPEHRRGHGALYGAVNCGRVDIARLRRALACLPLQAWDEGGSAGARCRQLATADSAAVESVLPSM